MMKIFNDEAYVASKQQEKVYKSLNERHGRLKVIESLMNRNKFCLNVGSKEVHFGNNAVNMDIDIRCRPNVVGDARHLPFRSEIFEQILFTEVIEHLPKGNEPRALREIRRVLLEKGEVILTTPNKRLLFTLLDPALYLIGHRHYTMKEIKKMLEACGFNFVKMFTSGFLWTCTNVVWYTFITYPVKKIFNYSLPYVPFRLRLFEDREYETIDENGYTLFVKAFKT